MPKPATGLYNRTGSTVYQWRIRVPKDLAHLYPGKEWAYRQSLRTSIRADATRLAAGLYATWLTNFDKQRQQLNPQLASLTPDLIQFLSDTLKHELLASDQIQRESGLPDEIQAEIAEDNLEEGCILQEAIKWGTLENALPALEYQASKQGIKLNETTPGINEALRAILHAQLEAALARISRDSGRLVITPPAPALKKPVKVQYHLRDIFDLWKGADGFKLTADTIRSRELALELFEKFTHNTPIAEITRMQGRDFKAWLQTKGASSKTSSDRLMYVNALFKYATRELELIDKNPWDGISIESETETKRKPWSTAQISAFFAQSLYTSYILPRLQKGSGADAGYWIPLLGLFSGARSAELCLLHCVDIVQIDGIWIIDINEDADGKSVKTRASHRLIPVHSELIRLGFLDYVEATRKANHERLWPKLSLREGKPSHSFSKWFNEKPRRAIPDVDIPDFHSLRHTVRTAMTAAKVKEQDQDRITGHELQGSTGTKVYGHVDLPLLVEVVEAIRYKDFNLPRSYPQV